MATVEELKEVVKETLVKSGVLPEIKARIRAEVFNVLQDNSESPPPLSNENLVINELIREYLIFNGYSYTESVLMAESGQPRLPLDKEFLQQQLQIKPNRDSANIPLLYSLVSYFMKENKPSSSIVPPHSPPSKLKL